MSDAPCLSDWTPPPVPPRETLEGRFVRVEPIDAQRHGDALWEALGDDPDGWRYLPNGRPADRAAHDAWLADCVASGDPLFFALVPTDTGVAAGVASYLAIVDDHGSVEAGHLHFGLRMRRSPATTEAMSLMADRAFDLGYRRYEWKCDARNLPSRRAAQRLGFSFEGLFRQHRVVKGHNRDTAWFSILDSEWPAIRDAHRRWLAPDNFDADGRQRTSLSSLTRPLLSAIDPDAAD